MKKLMTIVALLLVCSMAFSAVVSTKNATLKFSMKTPVYDFGFATSETDAKAGTSTDEIPVNDVSGTVYFFWKVECPDRLKITLSSDGAMICDGADSPVKDYQKIHYSMTVTKSTETGWWPDGSVFAGGTISTRETPISTVSANLKGTNNYFYTQGICNVAYKLLNDDGTDVSNLASLKSSKQGGDYTSTITLTIETIS